MISGLFPSYFLGHYPTARYMLSTYESNFAGMWGERGRNIMNEHGVPLFGQSVDPDHAARNDWKLVDHSGGMVTVGMGGALTGKGADVLGIDDPIKNSDEALSETVQQSMVDWFYSSAKSRLEPGGAIIITATRWTENDLIGQILEREPGKWTVVNYPALWPEDPGPYDVDLGRKPGEALWPERYDRATLEELREANSFWFDALYQGRPRSRESRMFQREFFNGKIVPNAPANTRFVRFWDFAATDGGGDWTVGVLMGEHNGTYFVADVDRFQLAGHRRDERIKATCFKDKSQFRNYRVAGEEEPGSSGKTAALAFVKLLAGLVVTTERSTGDKDERARPFASQCEAGNVYLVNGPWIPEYLRELCNHPGKNDDQVDASSGAFAQLLKRGKPGRASAAGRNRLAPLLSVGGGRYGD